MISFYKKCIFCFRDTPDDELDINSCYMGRDCFDSKMSRYFTDIRRFYTDAPRYKKSSWIKLDDLMIFPIIPNKTIDPLNEIRQYVFFEYRK